MPTAAYAPHTSPDRVRAPSRLMLLAETRAVVELAAFYATFPLLAGLPRGDGHPVLVLPGFLASDSSTRPLRRLLSRLDYDAHGWELGRNVHVDSARVRAMTDRLLHLYRQSGRKVSIVGWSLGGVFARELAKMHPEAVRQIITLGSPISDNRDHSNAKNLFEYLNGQEPEPLREGKFRRLHEAPPVPTSSILTRSDGIVHWRGSVQQPGGQTENIEVRASHIGLGVNPSVMIAIADRLQQPDGEWVPFAPRLSHRWMFPQNRLH
ncbi:MAG TPA: alpha/beta hydrolase [Novosphingobium sp.]|nr:alpha/beta hydrolase [Novosphingobium sp.]